MGQDVSLVRAGTFQFFVFSRKLPEMAKFTSKDYTAAKKSYLQWARPDQESNVYSSELTWHVLLQGRYSMLSTEVHIQNPVILRLRVLRLFSQQLVLLQLIYIYCYDYVQLVSTLLLSYCVC